jgi:SAM-dependent methyltransferase
MLRISPARRAATRHDEGMASDLRDWEQRAEDLAAEALAAGTPTAWFDRVYAAGRRGEVSMPWDFDEPNPVLVEWASRQPAEGTGRSAGRSAVVVGCGLGRDAEFVARLGFTTTAFDVAETPIKVVQERHPDSPVRYTVADLFRLPAEWAHAFDLVVESYTVQALPVTVRAEAIRNVAGLVAPGGRLVVVAGARDATHPPPAAPPWPLTRAEIDRFATDGLVAAAVERGGDGSRWLAEFHSGRTGVLPGA